jgi:hypothetical protein
VQVTQLSIGHESRPSHVRRSPHLVDHCADPASLAEKDVAVGGPHQDEDRRYAPLTHDRRMCLHDDVEALVGVEAADIREPRSSIRYARTPGGSSDVRRIARLKFRSRCFHGDADVGWRHTQHLGDRTRGIIRHREDEACLMDGEANLEAPEEPRLRVRQRQRRKALGNGVVDGNERR